MDEALKGAAHAVHPRKALQLLQETSAGAGVEILAIAAIDPIKHWPGRRLTVRYRVEARRPGTPRKLYTLYGKLYRGRKGDRVFRGLKHLRAVAPPALVFPEPLGYHKRRRFLLLGGLEGSPLSLFLRDAELPRYLPRVGRALADFHRLPTLEITDAETGPIEWSRHDAAAEAKVLVKAFERISQGSLQTPILGRYQEACHQVVESLTERGSPSCTRPLRIIHRDLYPDQIILSGSSVGMVDLDEIALGEPELDLGNLIAHLLLTDVQACGAERSGLARSRVLLRSYRQVAQLAKDRVAIYAAGSLLRLASMERLARPEISVLDWPKLVDALVREAMQMSAETLHEDDGVPRTTPL